MSTKLTQHSHCILKSTIRYIRGNDIRNRTLIGTMCYGSFTVYKCWGSALQHKWFIVDRNLTLVLNIIVK